MRHSGSTLALALLVAGCGGAPAETAYDPTRTADAYAACRQRSAGQTTVLLACADTAITAAGQAVDTPESAAAFRAALRRWGDAAAQSGGVSAQVTFAHHAVALAARRAALLSGDAPALRTAAAPLDGGPLWAKSRAISCRDHAVPHCAERYDALLSGLGLPRANRAAMARAAPPTGLPLPRCEAIAAEGKVGGALVDAFYARYPKALAGSDSVETVPLDPAALDNVVRYLVCVAGATDEDPTVAENGLALFGSKRHGAAARQALAALARHQDPIAGAARRFEAQINGYLQGPR
ncbi:hypothetical protein [Sphingomonas sp.]|uniref:hypothetical protein n=1 Tax=Sphingomonas sp. TaxID=28214 RepID=UPI0028B08204|nr:hypothetical protein [Sphingomonas sp.]